MSKISTLANLQNQSEDAFQQACVFWFGMAYPHHRRLLHHSPNEGKRSYYIGRRLQAMAMQKGYPDLFLAVPRGGYHGLYVELKSNRGRLTDEQEVMLALLAEQGYKTAVCKPPVSNFIQLVTNYMELN